MTYRIFKNSNYIADLVMDEVGEYWSMGSSTILDDITLYFIIELLREDPDKKAVIIDDDLYTFEIIP